MFSAFALQFEMGFSQRKKDVSISRFQYNIAVAGPISAEVTHMSWDIYLTDRVTGSVLRLDSPHMMRGGTYQVGGTTELWLNVTYNYSQIYRRDSVFGKDGIKTIFGKTGLESIPLLEKAINALGNDVTENYWDATEGNAKRALVQLLTMAKMRPDGVWKGE